MTWRKYSIQTQVTRLLAGLAVLFVAMTWAVQVFVIQPSFASLEKDDARRNLLRCTDAIVTCRTCPAWSATGVPGTTPIGLSRNGTIPFAKQI